jgi:dipeptidyl aminopeptidase/acylaminoacyl peptidase
LGPSRTPVGVRLGKVKPFFLDTQGKLHQWGDTTDSEDIVYRSRKSKDNGLTKYILKSTEISTRGVTDLTTELEWVSIPSYSRTREIMYVHNSKLKQRRKTVDERTMEVEISSEENVADNVPANAIVDVPSRDKVVIEDDEGIKIMDRSGKNRKTIIRHGQNNFAVDAKVSPSSSRVLFFNNVGPIGHLYVYELETEKIVDLGEGYFGQWLPDGRIVYCIATNDGYVHTSSDLYVINADGAGKMKITNTSDQIEIQPDVSPDGKSVAYRDDKSGRIYRGALRIRGSVCQLV